MAITAENVEQALKEMGISFEKDGTDFSHTTRGNFAPLLHSVISLEEDGSGATFLTALVQSIPESFHTRVCELLNLVHGQSLWNVRFHLDESGRVFSTGKHLLWGKPFNPIQFGDIFFSLLVTTDRLYPCLQAILEGQAAAEAFEKFFSGAPQPENDLSGSLTP